MLIKYKKQKIKQKLMPKYIIFIHSILYKQILKKFKPMYKTPNGKIIYPEDIECVHDPVNGKGGIFIGNLEAAENLATLKKYGIKAILTAAKGILLNHPKIEVPYQLYIPGEDHEKFDMSKFFNQSIKFIRDALQKTNILVHCLAGVSRSVSLVMAYFIKYQNMGYDSVYMKIKSKRKIIHPNDGFISQLKIFEAECREKGPVVHRQEHFEMRASYSPSKRYERRGYEGVQLQPRRFYESPEQKYTKRNKEFKYIDYERSDRYKGNQMNFSMSNNNMSTVKNPQLYKSSARDLNILSDSKRYAQQSSLCFSPQRLKMTNQSFAYKRASMNIDDLKMGYKKNQDNNDLRSRHEFKPLDSIQNREHDINAEIDRKIAQIRKKYQEYTKNSSPSDKHKREYELKSKLDRKYTTPLASEQFQLSNNNNQNNFSEYQDMKMRKMLSYQNGNIRDQLYANKGRLRKENNYLEQQQHRERQYLNNVNINNASSNMGNRLRRLQSYQV